VEMATRPSVNATTSDKDVIGRFSTFIKIISHCLGGLRARCAAQRTQTLSGARTFYKPFHNVGVHTTGYADRSPSAMISSDVRGFGGVRSSSVERGHSLSSVVVLVLVLGGVNGNRSPDRGQHRTASRAQPTATNLANPPPPLAVRGWPHWTTSPAPAPGGSFPNCRASRSVSGCQIS
jgi:hypothetical protein